MTDANLPPVGRHGRTAAISAMLALVALGIVAWAGVDTLSRGAERPVVALALALGLIASNLVPVVSVEAGRVSAFTPVGALLVPLGLLLPTGEAILAYSVGETLGILASHWRSPQDLGDPGENRLARTSLTTAKSIIGAAAALVLMGTIADADSPVLAQMLAAFAGVAASSMFDHVVLAVVAWIVRRASLTRELVRDLGGLAIIGIGEAIVGAMIAVLAGRDQWSLVLGLATFALLLMATASYARSIVEQRRTNALLQLAHELQDAASSATVLDGLIETVRQVLPEDELQIVDDEPDAEEYRAWYLEVPGQPDRWLALRRIADTRDYEEQALGIVEAAVSLAHVALVRVASQERLVEQDRLRSLVLSTVAHDLRTPLTSAAGAVRTLQRAADRMTPKQIKDMERVALRSVSRAQRIVDDLAELQRRGEDDAAPPDPVDVGEVVDDLVRRLDVNGARIEVSTQSGMAAIDRVGVERIVENLVVNAVKFSPADGVVAIQVTDRDDGVEVVVADDGPGVPPELRPSIFEAFEQAGSSRGGVGLGLYVAREFTRRHGGRIWVDSSDSGGAAFHVLLPHPSTTTSAPVPAEPAGSDEARAIDSRSVSR